MSRFGPDPRRFFDTVYAEGAPWDVGGPQPGLTELFRDYPPAGPVLDLGCGSGDLAIWLAGSGLEVLGIDFSEAAIEQALARADPLPQDTRALLEFRVADALRPSTLGRRFRSVVDSGFYHLFDPDELQDLPRELAAVLEPGGRYYVLAFDIEFPIENVPRRVEEAEIWARFTEDSGWRVLAVRKAEFFSRVGAVPATAACVEWVG